MIAAPGFKGGAIGGPAGEFVGALASGCGGGSGG